MATLDSGDYEVAYVTVAEEMSQDTDSVEYDVLANNGIHEIPIVIWHDEDARRQFISSWAEFVNEHCGAVWARVSDDARNIEVADSAYVSERFLDFPEGMEPLGAMYYPQHDWYRDRRRICKAACRAFAAGV